LGSVGAALNKEALKSLNITHVLIVARSLNASFPTEFIYKKIEGNVSCTFVSFDSFLIFIGTNIDVLYMTSIVRYKTLIMFLD
jgi:hypothetical protein